MIRVSVLYGNTEGKKFDMGYYVDKHMPMVRQKLGAACKRIDVDQGVGGGKPGDKPPFVCMTHMLFDSGEAFQAAFGPHAKEIVGDIPNFIDIQPAMQVSEVKA